MRQAGHSPTPGERGSGQHLGRWLLCRIGRFRGYIREWPCGSDLATGAAPSAPPSPAQVEVGSAALVQSLSILQFKVKVPNNRRAAHAPGVLVTCPVGHLPLGLGSSQGDSSNHSLVQPLRTPVAFSCSPQGLTKTGRCSRSEPPSSDRLRARGVILNLLVSVLKGVKRNKRHLVRPCILTQLSEVLSFQHVTHTDLFTGQRPPSHSGSPPPGRSQSRGRGPGQCSPRPPSSLAPLRWAVPRGRVRRSQRRAGRELSRDGLTAGEGTERLGSLALRAGSARPAGLSDPRSCVPSTATW